MNIKEIKNLVLGVEMVPLEDLKPFQPDNLKILTTDNFEKLKNSLIKNNFIAAFSIWKSNEHCYILDGHHRRLVLQELKKEGFIIPDKFPCNIIDVKSKKQAIDFLLTYSSEYAHPDKEGVSEFIHTNNLDFDLVNSFTDLRDIDLIELKMDSIDFEPVDEQPRLDEKTPIICPNCNHEFVP